MQQAYAGGDVTVRPHRWLLLTAGAAYEDYTLKDPTGDLISGRGRLHARDRARRRRRSRVPAHDGLGGVRLAAGRRLRAARRALPGRAPSLRRSRRHLQLRPARRRGRAAHSDPARELGDLAARPAARRRSTTTIRCRTSCCRRSAAAARCAATAAGASAIATPCCCRASGGGSRIAWRSTWRSSTTPAWSRPASMRSRSSSFVSDFGVGVRFHGPARTPLRIELAQGPRRLAARVRRERGVLIMATSTRLDRRLGTVRPAWPAAPALLAGADRALLRRRSAGARARDAGRRRASASGRSI